MRKRVFMCAVAAVLSGAVLSTIYSFGQAVPTTGPGAIDPSIQAAGGGTGTGAPPGAAVGGRGRGRGGIPDPNAELTNLSIVATATASSGNPNSLTGGAGGRGAGAGGGGGGGGGRGGFGFTTAVEGGTQWVELAWDKPIVTNKIDVSFVDPAAAAAGGRGRNGGAGAQGRNAAPAVPVSLPKAARLKSWNGTAWVDVDTQVGVAGGRNIASFAEVTTSKLRLEMDAPEQNPSMSVTQFRVFDSGKSPDFAPIAVTANGDRVVVLTGKTYLNGNLREVKRGVTQVSWSKESGPGTVAFEDAKASTTTATFSVLGDYVLKLNATAAGVTKSDSVEVKVQPPSTAQPLLGITTTKYQLNSNLWDARIKAQIVGWVRHCVDYIEQPELHPNLGPGGLDNFIDAAARLQGKDPENQLRHRGYVFSNAWVHNTVESMCLANMVDAKGDKDILKAQADNLATLDKWIPIIIAAQEPDGYLQTAHTLGNWQRWSPQSRGNHEGYTQGYFLESAEAHYHMTKGADRRLYDAAKRCADAWCDNIGPGKIAWYDGHQEMEKALVRFGRLVNEVDGKGKGEKYIQLAKFLLDNRKGGSDYDQSQAPVVQQYEAVGHAVRASYTYAGMSAVMAETGDIDYQSATKSLWDNIVNKKLYLTGGIGSGETSEGFGPNYSLRNNAYCESCSNCGQVFFQYNMNLAFREAKYADLVEDTLYNAVLGDTDLAGLNFCYTNALDTTGTPAGRGPGQGTARYAWHGCPCCVGNIPRTLIMLPTWTYSTSPDSLYVNMFLGSTMTVPNVKGTSVQMVQQTNYPWDGKVAITVNPTESKNFALRIRLPDRQSSALYINNPPVKGISSLAVNGAAVANPTIQDGYAVITRDWKAGDKVELNIPMQPQRVTAINQVAADRGKVALRYGPIIYNIEAVDNADVTAAMDMKAPLTTEWKSDLLGGVMIIKGKFADGSDLIAIPNYARLNRGGRSLVWMNAQAPAQP